MCRNNLILGAAALFILTLVAYLPALRNGFVWDDDVYVTRNQALRSVNGLGKIWARPESTGVQYYPLTLTSFWGEYHVWKLWPLGYHLVNVLLHALNAALLWLVLRRLEIRGAWWATALFALHPVQVESVAWITERKNVLSGMFSLLSLLAFFRFRPLSSAPTTPAWDWRFYRLATLLFLCALLSKTAVCCLPVVVLALIWWKRDCVERRDVLALIPWFAVSMALALITVSVERNLMGASGTEWTRSIVQRWLTAGRVLWFYAGKLVWPHQLTFIYPLWEIDAGEWWQYLFPLAVLAVLIVFWFLRQRIGKGPLVAVLCFASILFPQLGLFDVYFYRYSFVADHLQYLACISLIVLVVSAGAAISQRAGQRGRSLGPLAAASGVLTLGVSTWRQAHVYQDLETLWRDTLTKNPSAWMAHNNLGVILQDLGKVSEAMEHYQQALRLKPDYVEAHNNLGNALALAGKFDDAIRHYERALHLKPDYAEAHNNLGNALSRAGKFDDAIGQYRQALALKPDYAEAHNNLGVALAMKGSTEEAIAHFSEVLRIRPDFADAAANLRAAREVQRNHTKSSRARVEVVK